MNIRSVFAQVLAVAAFCALAAESAWAGPEAARLLDGFASVKTLSCEMRRDKPLPGGGTVRMLSRVLYEAPNRINSENVTPVARRTVCDGERLWQHVDELETGFSRPVAELPDEMRDNLGMLPGSNANLLWTLRDAAEEPLDPEDGIRRVGHALENAYAILGFDDEGRWVLYEVRTPDREGPSLLKARYSDFQELAPGVWLACRQESVLHVQGVRATESLRITRVRANDPIPAASFDGEAFFPGVRFVSDFGESMR